MLGVQTQETMRSRIATRASTVSCVDQMSFSTTGQEKQLKNMVKFYFKIHKNKLRTERVSRVDLVCPTKGPERRALGYLVRVGPATLLESY